MRVEKKQGRCVALEAMPRGRIYSTMIESLRKVDFLYMLNYNLHARQLAESLWNLLKIHLVTVRRKAHT